MNKISIVSFIVVLLAISGFLFYKEGSLPVNKNDTEPKTFVIEPGTSLDTIINNLSKDGLIRNRVLFYLIVKQKGIERQIQAGDFRLSPSMNAFGIADELTHGTLDTRITIPEGMRKEEIAEILSSRLGIPETEFNSLALEGRLFPDTYDIPKTSTAQQVVDLLTNTFEEKYNAEIDQKIQAKNLTKQEAIILASLVEREANGDEDRQEIANIIYKRFLNDWALQVDATIQYALGYDPEGKTWWRVISRDDYTNVKSEYNTYLNPGLPPGPIGNPGIASFEAVANADAKTPYWYYYHDSTGKAFYSVKLEDHENNAAK